MVFTYEDYIEKIVTPYIKLVEKLIEKEEKNVS